VCEHNRCKYKIIYVHVYRVHVNRYYKKKRYYVLVAYRERSTTYSTGEGVNV
jgi:hypothetical protein